MFIATVFRIKTVCILLISCSLCSCAMFKPPTPPPVPSDYEFFRKYSEKFGVQFTGTENKKLILAVDQWLGAPHKLGGCTKRGVDCSCFVQSVYKQVYGVTLSRSSSEMYSDVGKVRKKDLKEGDLLFLKGPDKKISHVGIFLKDDKFVHVTTAQGVVISSLRDDWYKKSFHAAGRIQGLQ